MTITPRSATYVSDFVIRICGHSYFVVTGHKGHYRRDNENVNQRDLEKEEPAEAHKLIIAKSGQGPSHPHEKENNDGHLREEDCDVDQTEDPSVRSIGNSRQMPAAKK